MLRLLCLLLFAALSFGQEGRVVVLGFDGADARTVERLIEAGKLPNLARLAEEGTLAPLLSTHPAESAAGWAALNTGTNPLVNGVGGFLRRNVNGRPEVESAHVATKAAQIEEHGRSLSSRLMICASIVLLVTLGMRFLTAKTGQGLLVGFVAALPIFFLSSETATLTVPTVYESQVRAPGFWDVAAEGGARAIVLDAALAFGREEQNGARVLGGLGLPDATAAMNGAWSIYTTDERQLSGPPVGTPTRSGSGRFFRVTERQGSIATRLYGPVDFTRIESDVQELIELEESDSPKASAKRATVEAADKAFVELVLERERNALAITLDGERQAIEEGQWSDWFRPTFVMESGLEVHAVTRARVLSAGEPLSVYFDVLHLDPEHPTAWQPISSPPGFSADLAEWSGGPYETLGWACMTNPIKDRVLPPEVFLEDIEFTMRWRERLTRACLERDDWELLFSVFSSVDRVQHMMYRHADPGHPRHDPAEAARRVTFLGREMPLSEVIDASYELLDRVVGFTLEHLGPNDELLLCADHGFTSFRWGFHVNNWLAREGYLVSRPPTQGGIRSSLMRDVDWSRTRAYALGLGMIYLNLEGREPMGIVPEHQAAALLDEIRGKLLMVTDPGPAEAPFTTPVKVVRDAVIMSEHYSGGEPWGELDWPCADLMLGLEDHYRVSWDTVAGEVRYQKGPQGRMRLAPNFGANNSPWSGDHASNAPSVVSGIFFSRRPVDVPEGGVSVMHIAPTVLDRLGVDVPEEMDRAALNPR